MCGCRSAASTATSAAPLVLGNRSPSSPVYQVVASVGFGATSAVIKKGQRTWVSGSHVDKFVAAGTFQIVQTLNP